MSSRRAFSSDILRRSIILALLKGLFMMVVIVELGGAKMAYDEEKPDKMVLNLAYAICFAIMWAHI